MSTKIIVQGKIEHIQTKEYQGKTTTVAQLIAKSEKKGFEIIKIKIIDENSIIKTGDSVSIPISIATMNNQIFYSQADKIEIGKA